MVGSNPGLRRCSAPFVRDCGVKRGDGLAPYYEDGSPSSRLRECPFAVCHCSRDRLAAKSLCPIRFKKVAYCLSSLLWNWWGLRKEDSTLEQRFALAQPNQNRSFKSTATSSFPV